jgi:hypothetical protein
MWLKLFDDVINLDKVKRIELVYDGKRENSIVFHFDDGTTHTIYEDYMNFARNREFQKVWFKLRKLPVLFDWSSVFQEGDSEKLDKEKDVVLIKDSLVPAEGEKCYE